jgi:hypothetical protein
VKSLCCALILAVVPSAWSFLAEPRDGGNEKWATVKGRVIFAGEKVPEPEVHRGRDGRLFPGRRWVVDKETKGVQGVLVWLTDDPKDRGVHMAAERIHPDLRKPPAVSFEVCTVEFQFYSAVFGLRSGQKLRFTNTMDEPTNLKYQALLQSVWVKSHMLSPSEPYFSRGFTSFRASRNVS